MRFTSKTLFDLIYSHYNNFKSNFSNSRSFQKWYPVGRYCSSAEDWNHPLFVSFNQKKTKGSVMISIKLYTADEHPSGISKILLRTHSYNNDFSYDQFLSDIKAWDLDPSLSWEEDLTLFIDAANKKYK